MPRTNTPKILVVVNADQTHTVYVDGSIGDVQVGVVNKPRLASILESEGESGFNDAARGPTRFIAPRRDGGDLKAKRDELVEIARQGGATEHEVKVVVTMKVRAGSADAAKELAREALDDGDYSDEQISFG